MTTSAQIRPAARLILLVALVVELAVAAALTLRFALGHDQNWGDAAWSGLFHAVSAYNNAGFGLRSDSMMAFATDPWTLGLIAISIIIGGLGLPVLWDMRENRMRQRVRWSLHSKITVAGTMLLLVLGTLGTLATEWTGVLAGETLPQKLLASAFYSVSLRTAGFNNFAMDGLSDGTLVLSSALMLVGAGSASTGGGIKVATAMILLLVVVSELKGREDVTAFGRRISSAAIRRATAIILIAVALVVLAALLIAQIVDAAGADIPMRAIAFECVSAFATVGLSTGITAALPDAAQGIIIFLMFVGRVGPVTLGAAFILRNRHINYRYPAEDPIIG